MTHFHTRDGKRSASCHKVIEDCGLLSEDYHVKAKALQTKYYALEIDSSLTKEQKENYMLEWVTLAHELLISNNFSKKMLVTAVGEAISQERIRLRDLVPEFLQALASYNVPILIFSAGIADILERVLANSIAVNADLVYVLSNRCIFDDSEDEYLIDFATPVLHVCNKKSASFLHTDFFCRTDFSTRRNLIILGDSLGDADMCDGIEHDGPESTVLRIGFLNDKVDERLEIFLDTFDLVIFGDPSFEVPLKVISAVCEGDDCFLQKTLNLSV
jgi:5'-nucleotidase